MTTGSPSTPRRSRGGFGQGDHFGEFGADDGLRDEGFAEDDALVRPFEAFFGHEADPADYAAAHHPAFLLGSVSWRFE